MAMYLKGTWTCPASNPGTSDKQWDLSVLTKKEFLAKYKISPQKYEELKAGKK